MEAEAHLPKKPSMPYSMGLQRQPKASSSPTITGKAKQMASTTAAEIGNRILPPVCPASSVIWSNDINTLSNTQATNKNTQVVYSTGEQFKTHTSASTAATNSLPFSFHKNEQKAIPTQQNTSLSAQVELQLKLLEEQQNLQQQFLERKYQILSQVSGDSEHPQPNNLNSTGTWNYVSGPTPSQLAARQAIPRDLPNFHGDPEEWPLFVSSFENSTSVAGYSHAENLIRLQNCLKGRAKELVKSKLMLPTMVPEIIQTLRMYFGRPEHILERVIEKARQLPPPKDRLESMIDFALAVKNIYSTMETCKMESHMNNPMLVKEFVGKLSSQYKLNWAMYPKDHRIPIVKTFSDWIFQIADAASSVVSAIPAAKNANINTHTEARQFQLKCYVCEGEHKVSVCGEFKQLSLQRKWDVVKKNNLCRLCLNKHKGKCFVKKECGANGCKIKHHRLLHNYNDESDPVHIKQNTTMQSNNTSSEMINSHSTTQQTQSKIFRILPIRLHKKNGFINTYAFLDEGSSVSLIEKEVFDLLDIDSVEQSLCLKWTGNTTRQENSSLKASIDISNVYNGDTFKLKSVYTVKNLGLPRQTLNMEDMVAKHPYLQGLPIQSYKNIRPSILIGLNNWSVAVPLKIREGPWNQPIATKTRLGWSIQGNSGHPNQEEWLNIHHCDCEKRYNELHNMVKKNFNIEESTNKPIMSAEDSKAMDILKTTCQKS
ncbi:hypothetical protein EVAR_69129_1 [Eumeta japonica]|uniref:Peptidase aspartic putative domain-containing protein n=1 Tax=Eumeta variegata TaxID=151549 RepID=A0A4C1SPK5_EUMVA|nr:hypothetical protein EVAR_69129_1 [Eumeta japonica]